MNILILRFSSIGDIVLTTPIVRCIKKKYPEAKIHFCTKKSYSSLLENNPHIDKIIPLNESFSELIQELKKTNYDYLFDLHHNLRTLRIKLLMPRKTKVFSFNKINLEKYFAVKFKNKTILPKTHLVDRYFDTCKVLQLENDLAGLDYYLPQNLVVDELPADFKTNYIALVVGAQFKTKQVPSSKLIDLCTNSKHKFIIIGGKEDVELGEKIAQQCKNVLNVCGKYSLDGSALLIKNAQLVISNDTGMMHIASAFNKKIISIWGNTIPEFGMFPYMPKYPENYSIHEVKNLSCRPCSKIGFQSCPKKHFKCMEMQNTDKIITEINLKLNL